MYTEQTQIQTETDTESETESETYREINRDRDRDRDRCRYRHNQTEPDRDRYIQRTCGSPGGALPPATTSYDRDRDHVGSLPGGCCPCHHHPIQRQRQRNNHKFGRLAGSVDDCSHMCIYICLAIFLRIAGGAGGVCPLCV